MFGGTPTVSETAALSLAWMEHPTQEVIGALIEVTRTADDNLRFTATLSLGRLGSRNPELTPEVVAAIVVVLKGKDFVKKQRDVGLRANAAGALSLVGAGAKAAVPDLLDALRAEGAPDARTARALRGTVVYALGAIGPGAAAARSQLEDIVRSKDSTEQERRDAIDALKKIIKE
jgi:HEAT repeat protein